MKASHILLFTHSNLILLGVTVSLSRHKLISGRRISRDGERVFSGVHVFFLP